MTLRFTVEVYGNDFLVPIPFPLPSNHSHSHSHPFSFQFPAATTLKPRNMYVVSWIHNKIWIFSKSIVNQTHHSSVIVIITITVCHCSLFNVYQTVTACYDEYGREFYFSPIKYVIHIPIKTIPIPISSQKLLPSPWECHENFMKMGIPIPCTPLLHSLDQTNVYIKYHHHNESRLTNHYEYTA